MDRFLATLQTAIQHKNGKDLALLFSRSSQNLDFFRNNVQVIHNQANLSGYENILGNKDWFEMVQHHCNAAIAYELKDVVESQLKALKVFSDKIYNDLEEWVIPLMAILTRDQCRIALALFSRVKEEEVLSPTANVFQAIFSQTMNCRMGKRAGGLSIVNCLIRLYKRLSSGHNQLEQIFRKVVHADIFKVLQSTSTKAELVTFKFYFGYLNFVDGKYSKAEESLQFAFENCKANMIEHRRHILMYLIPVKLLKNISPRESLLKKYKLDQFGELIMPMKTGNVGKYSQLLLKYEEYFVSKGLYVVMEKLKMNVYRNLAKRVFDMTHEGKNRLSLVNFQKALSIAQESCDMDECECIVANLVYNKFVAGYVSHAHKLVVLAKNNPFPPL